jgi:hypothetical protein
LVLSSISYFSESYLKDESKALEKAQKALDRATARQQESCEKDLKQTQEALVQKELGLDPTFLQESMIQLSGLIFYPEITDAEALKKHAEQSGNKDRIRDNSPENLGAAIAKYVHVLSATYPELPEKLFNLHDAGKTWDESRGSKKDEALKFVTQIFTQHLITSPYQSKSGEHDQGWPTFAHDAAKIREIGDNATALVYQYKELQEEHSYQKTSGYRSRASSGAMEEMQQRILEPVIGFIGENFGLEKERFEGLFKQLKELDLSEKSDEEFNVELLEKVKEYCEEDRTDESHINNLAKLLFPSQLKTVGVEK